MTSSAWGPFFLVLALACCQRSLASAPPKIASVIWDTTTSSYKVVDGTVAGWVAWGNFTDQIDQNGWSFLNVITDENHNDQSQAYAAGLVEGYLTTDLMYKFWMNTVDGYCSDPQDADYCARLYQFLDDNRQWIKSQTVQSAATDPYWHQVDLVMQQQQGIQDGYQSTFPISATDSDILNDYGFLFFQLAGDLEDLEMALNKTYNVKRILGSGSCSALIKPLPGNSDLYVAHDTWSTYQSMLRVLKLYEFHFHQTDQPGSPLVPGFNVSFSSYPGTIISIDDFYVVSSGLTTMETTIGNNNNALWQYVQPNTIFEYVRVTVANRLATDGSTWTTIFGQHNSGTYNNEWMVVDYNKFTPGEATLQDGLLWISEQLPGMYESEDRTDTIRQQGYWASYNAPYFPDIFNASGCVELVETYGDWYSYDKTPRALIFKRDHGTVVDIDTMIALMRSNDYTNDPLSACECTPPYSAENAISARSDLNPANGTYPFDSLGHRSHGGIDMKLTTYSSSKTLQFIAYGGPTYDKVPPFQWSTFDLADSTPHMGQPDLWQFRPVYTLWN